MTDQRGQRKTRVGQVVSDAMDKTVVVAIERRVQHPRYHKSVRRIKKFKAHDELNQYQLGDTVRLVETRPLSKTKRWRVAELLFRQDVAGVNLAAVSLPADEQVDVESAAPLAEEGQSVAEAVEADAAEESAAPLAEEGQSVAEAAESDAAEESAAPLAEEGQSVAEAAESDAAEEPAAPLTEEGQAVAEAVEADAAEESSAPSAEEAQSGDGVEEPAAPLAEERAVAEAAESDAAESQGVEREQREGQP